MLKNIRQPFLFFIGVFLMIVREYNRGYNYYTIESLRINTLDMISLVVFAMGFIIMVIQIFMHKKNRVKVFAYYCLMFVSSIYLIKVSNNIGNQMCFNKLKPSLNLVKEFVINEKSITQFRANYYADSIQLNMKWYEIEKIDQYFNYDESAKYIRFVHELKSLLKENEFQSVLWFSDKGFFQVGLWVSTWGESNYFWSENFKMRNVFTSMLMLKGDDNYYGNGWRGN